MRKKTNISNIVFPRKNSLKKTKMGLLFVLQNKLFIKSTGNFFICLKMIIMQCSKKISDGIVSISVYGETDSNENEIINAMLYYRYFI